MTDQDVRDQVRQRYAAAAVAVTAGGRDALSTVDADQCCGPSPAGENASCCGGGAEIDASFGSTLYSAGPAPTPEPATVAWNTNQKSTGTIQLQAAKTNPQRGTLHGTMSAGRFKGLRTTAAYRFALLTKNGCTVVPLKEISISGGPVTVK